jgi:hypothetical protein
MREDFPGLNAKDDARCRRETAMHQVGPFPQTPLTEPSIEYFPMLMTPFGCLSRRLVLRVRLSRGRLLNCITTRDGHAGDLNVRMEMLGNIGGNGQSDRVFLLAKERGEYLTDHVQSPTIP